jgi:N-acyl-D-amino-acid deacylase
MRNEGDKVADAIRESIQIGEQAGLPVEISHFKISNKKLWGQSPMTLGLVRDARARGLAVTVDQYAYTASSTSLDSRLPAWLRAGGLDEAKKRLADKATRERVIEDTKDALKRSGFKDYSFRRRCFIWSGQIVQRQIDCRDHQTGQEEERRKESDRPDARDV